MIGVKSQLVFQEESEIDRLAVQNRLLLSLEEPVFEQAFAGRTGLRVLDVGCNDGQKTVQRFSGGAVSRVIGLEYNEALAAQAQSRYGSDKFSFYPFDAEGEAFSRELGSLMERTGVEAFDVIYLSFLLMHLRSPERLLKALGRFLAPGGYLLIVEADDRASFLTPPAGTLLEEFLEILRRDPYSGNRELGRELLPLLERCGYGSVVLWHDCVRARGADLGRKEDIFTTFFSYLPEDVALLQKLSPENDLYGQWAQWLDKHFDTLKTAVLHPESTISMGMRILTCQAESKPGKTM